MYFVHILHASDNALYIGVTENVETRLSTHDRGKGASWIRIHDGSRPVYFDSHLTLGSAGKREIQLKKWSRAKKESLIAGDLSALKELSRSRSPFRLHRIA